MLLIILSICAILFAAVSVLLSIELDHEQSSEKKRRETELFTVHELRSPVASIKAAANLILDLDTKLPQEKKVQLLKVINAQSIKMLDTISLLLDTAKLQSAAFSIQKMPNDIKQVITERVDLYMPLAMEKSITIAVQANDTIPPFLFDKQYIGQVVSNLLANSLKFTPQNGKITVNINFDGKNVTVSVSDTGSGLNKEEENNLFKKFYQAHHSETANGSGLGLYFAKGIIEAHNGTLNVESQVHVGTTISFSLPFTPAQKSS